MSDGDTVLIFRKRLLPWSETFVAAQARSLRRYHPVFVGYTTEAGGLAYLDGCQRLLLSDYERIPGAGKAWLKYVKRVPRRFARALQATAPRLVHAHFGTSIPPAGVIARALRVPLIVTFHGHDIARESRTPEDAQRRARRMAEVDHAIAVSGFIAERVRAAGCPPERITLHHIGVDTDRFAPPPHRARNAHILFVGRLVPKKGLAHLLNALPTVLGRVPHAQLTVVGDGPLRTDAERQAAALGDRVRFLGVQTPDRIRELMQSAAVLAAPSIVTKSGDAEGLPITIMEALACGLPVVAYPSGGSAEGVRDGVTGRLVPPRDEVALAAALVELLLDDALRERMGVAARELALAEFSLRRQAERLEEIYDRVIDRF